MVDEVYPAIENEIFSLWPSTLGFPEDGCVTGYYSSNITREDLDLVHEFARSNKFDLQNTRIFKEDGRFKITVGSIKEDSSRYGLEFKGHTFDIVYGEFSPYLREVTRHL